MKSKRLKIILISVAFILLIPLVAMQFTDEVSWTIFDFVIMGVLLLGTGLLCEVVMRNVPKTKHRIVLLFAIMATFLVVWAELAVGVFDTPLAGN